LLAKPKSPNFGLGGGSPIMLDLGEEIDSGSGSVGLVCLPRGLGGTEFDNQTAFRFALVVLSISGSYSK